MSYQPQHYHTDPLWLRIEVYVMDQPGAAIPFSVKLARTNNWSADYTLRAMDEYKRFLYLCCISPTGAAPSRTIDQVWHLHLTYTVDYWQMLCRDTLQKEIHHHPSSGGLVQHARHQTWYSETLLLYKATFKQIAPADIWPTPAAAVIALPAFTAPRDHFINRAGKLLYLFLLVPFLAIFVFYGQVNPFSLTGPHFLVFYAILVLIVIIVTKVLVNRKLGEMLPLLKPLLRYAAFYDPSKIISHGVLEAPPLVSALVGLKLLQPLPIQPGDKSPLFVIDRQKVDESAHPMARYLREHSSFQIDMDFLKDYTSLLFAEGKAKTDALRIAYDNWYNDGILPAFLLAVGILRILQGFANDKPVFFLLIMTLGGYFMAKGIIKVNNFSNSCQDLLQGKNGMDNESNPGYINGLRALGVVALAAPAVLSLGNAGSCGGASCGSGGCGGGCGGCGGD